MYHRISPSVVVVDDVGDFQFFVYLSFFFYRIGNMTFNIKVRHVIVIIRNLYK